MRVIPLAVYGVWHGGTLSLSEMILGIASVFPIPAARIGIDLRTSKNDKLAPIHAFFAHLQQASQASDVGFDSHPPAP